MNWIKDYVKILYDSWHIKRWKKKWTGMHLTYRELIMISNVIRKSKKPNLLVFGMGFDSGLYQKLNSKGNTVFLEDKKQWFNKIKGLNPRIKAHFITYPTKYSDWKNIVNKESRLALNLPTSIKKTKWDIILIDGPCGDNDWHKKKYGCEPPGRMTSIYMASTLIKNGGDIFVHDCEREVENVYTNKYLKKENLVNEIKGRALLRHYKMRRNKDHFSIDNIKSNIKLVSGEKNISYTKKEAIVLCLVRNGETWIDEFIKHYQKKGFKHIVFLDNGSTDKTIEIAQKYDNVTILNTKLPFKEYNILLRRYLVSKFAKNRWSLTVDIDELWDYPNSHKIKLDTFLEYVNEQGANAVVAQMLDMFMETIPNKRKLLKNYNYYDLSSIKKSDFHKNESLKRSGFYYKKILSTKIKFFEGGIREQIFNVKNIWLSKIPLIYYDDTIEPITHQHYSNNATIANISTVLLHYKLTNNLESQCKDALLKKQYHENSKEYKKYKDKLDKSSNTILKQKTSRKLEDTNQLLEEKFLIAPEEYMK